MSQRTNILLIVPVCMHTVSRYNLEYFSKSYASTLYMVLRTEYTSISSTFIRASGLYMYIALLNVAGVVLVVQFPVQRIESAISG